MLLKEYTPQQLENLANRAWNRVLAANKGVCDTHGWHLELGPSPTLVLTYTDCNENRQRDRITL